MTPDPDVTPVGFAATDAPDAIVRRRRNPVWLLLAVVLAAGGIAGTVSFVLVQEGNAPGRDEAVAEGRVAALDGPDAAAARFEGEGDYTVWIEPDLTLSNVRETVVAATNCVASFGDARSVRFRGARQGASVTIGGRSTVGTFDAPRGTVEVTCRQEPFGRLRTRDNLRVERSFFVTAGKPGAGTWWWVGLFGGIVALILAPFAFGRWRTGTLRPRSA